MTSNHPIDLSIDSDSETESPSEVPNFCVFCQTGKPEVLCCYEGANCIHTFHTHCVRKYQLHSTLRFKCPVCSNSLFTKVNESVAKRAPIWRNIAGVLIPPRCALTNFEQLPYLTPHAAGISVLMRVKEHTSLRIHKKKRKHILSKLTAANNRLDAAHCEVCQLEGLLEDLDAEAPTANH